MMGKSKARDFIQYVMRHAPHAHMQHWHGDYAVAYRDGPCPKFTIYHAVHQSGVTDFYRRSLYNDMADQAFVAYKILDDAGREAFLPELYDRCVRNRRNRHKPFWSALTEEKDHDT